MADAAISFAVEKLGDALIQKVEFLRGVSKQVQWLKEELQSMRCFLKDAAEKQGHKEYGNLVRQWISDLRELAQDAEDVIEIFNLEADVKKPRRKRDLLIKWVGFPTHVFRLNRAGEAIESIRSRLVEIGRRRKRYGIQDLGVEPTSSSAWEMVELRRRMAARVQKDKDVVGLNEDADLLVRSVILDHRKGLSLAAIVGMGGIGKSTLARKIYNHPDVVARFEQRAWVVVSSEFEAEDIMKQIMHQLPVCVDPDKLEGVEDEIRRQEMVQQMRRKYLDELKEVDSVKEKVRRQEMLQEMLRQRLEGKHYFIVLDDVWEHKHWEALKTAFPDEQDKASRLLFTSRNQIITKLIHKMKLLNPDESWKLLLKTAVVGPSDERCPKELEDIGREILKKCHGLPLAITVAGGLLVNQGESERGWGRVLRQMTDYHSETSEIGTSVSAILELSYHNLPSQLKPCFLCLAFFKEDVVIPAKRLVHIWVALGLAKGQEARDETAEEVAMSYLDELVKRNLILVKDVTIDDRVKLCHVHDLLRDLSIRKAKGEIGFEESINSHEVVASKPRHRVVRGIGERLTGNENKHLRSLFLHVEGPSEAYFTTPSYWDGFQLLKILDIEGSRLRCLPSTMRALIGLRYLRLREVDEVPSWLDVLQNLEVLDIANNEGLTWPDVTWEMDNLRHVYIGGSGSMKISCWKNVETLKYIRSDNLLSGNPAEGFSRLRKLGVKLEDGTWQVEEKVVRLLAKSALQLQVLHLRWKEKRALVIPSRSLDCLTKLKLHGPLKWCPPADILPKNITHLTLSNSRITRDDDMMRDLGTLPKLLFLKFDFAVKNMGSMKVGREGFPRLKVLQLTRMHWLQNIEIEEGGMPQLQRLQIYQCPRLQTWNLRKCLASAEIIIVQD